MPELASFKFQGAILVLICLWQELIICPFFKRWFIYQPVPTTHPPNVFLYQSFLWADLAQELLVSLKDGLINHT